MVLTQQNAEVNIAVHAQTHNRSRRADSPTLGMPNAKVKMVKDA
jgi:hypothetical protein